MSRYDDIRSEAHILTRKRNLIVVPIVVAMAVLMTWISTIYLETWYSLGVLLSCILGFPMGVKLSLRMMSQKYLQMSDRLKARRAEMLVLKKKVHVYYGQFPRRLKGQLFKTAHSLKGKPLFEFEQSMVAGMHYERNEVFVTAFIRNRIVVRVTASIGSPYACRNADNPMKWPHHFKRLGCDEMRQYHNHPDHSNKTDPSPPDRKAHAFFNSILGKDGIPYSTYIVFWNQISEWRMLKYDHEKQSDLLYSFDVAA